MADTTSPRISSWKQTMRSNSLATLRLLSMAMAFTIGIGASAAAESLRDWQASPLQYRVWSSSVPSDIQGATASFATSPETWSGQPSAMISVPDGAAVSFYQYFLDLQGAREGEVYEFTALVRTENVTGGVGASLSIGTVDPKNSQNRIAAAESERLTGTMTWTAVRCAIFIPRGIETVRLLLLLHGNGQAWFDDVHVRKTEQLYSAAGKPVQIEITNETITEDFMGFGFEDDPFFFTEENFRHGISDEEVAMREGRIKELNPSVIAMLFWWDTINPAHDLETITYDTDLMRALYRVLEVHQKAGRQIFLSDTHWTWTKEQFPYSPANAVKGAKIYAKALRHLIRDKGFTCIQNVCVIGEADLIFESLGGTFESYIEANRTLRAELDTMGLRDVHLIGDKSGGLVWFRRAMRQIESCFGIFTVHEYPELTQFPIINDRLKNALNTIHENTHPVSQTAKGPVYKPAFVYEIGFLDQKITDPLKKGAAMPTFEYGLLCANSAIAAMNNGFVGGSVWCLQSMYYPGQNLMDFGLWEFKDKGWLIRPVYYSYGLFTKHACKGVKPVRVTVTPSSYDLSTACLVDRDGHHSFFAVNLSDSALTLNLTGLPDRHYDVFEYAEDCLPKPEDPLYAMLDALEKDKRWSPWVGTLVIRPKSLVMLTVD